MFGCRLTAGGGSPFCHPEERKRPAGGDFTTQAGVKHSVVLSFYLQTGSEGQNCCFSVKRCRVHAGLRAEVCKTGRIREVNSTRGAKSSLNSVCCVLSLHFVAKKVNSSLFDCTHI